MEDLIQLDRPVDVGGQRRSSRAVAVVAVLALVIGGLVLARNAAAPPTSDDKVVNVQELPTDGAGAVLGKSLGFGAPQAQIDISALVCPILDRIVAAIPFVAPFLARVRVLFGCISA